jgi:glycerate 2-kinase
MSFAPVARAIFAETLNRVGIPDVLRSRVRYVNGALCVGDLVYPMESFRHIMIVAIGKASVPMCEALLPILDPVFTFGKTLDGVVVSPVLSGDPDPRIRFFRGGHPLPDLDSLQAANAILQLLARADQATLVLFLISGGASAMVEKPLDPGVSLEETALFHGGLVRSGLPITQMNTLRKHFSQVKGGRLALAAGDATQCTLLISDVPANSLDAVGSGPSLPDPSTTRDCLRIIECNHAVLAIPPRVLTFFQSRELQETPKQEHPAFRRAEWLPLLSSEDLSSNAAALASQANFAVVIDNTCDDWDYRRAARYLVDRMVSLREQHTKVCIVSVGEVSVKVDENHGAGGRNQQFVLECARLIRQEALSITVLSGGSDGIDGQSPAAGAICDETTWDRAAAHGFDPAVCLAHFDSYPLFKALGDDLFTGPTGNNLRDLRILMSGLA